MSTYLYGQAMINTGKKRFLDKTPRYYLIIPQLLRTFPDAHFVVLLRNPLAVMASIARTWAKEEWLHLRAYKCDLLNAPDLLCKGIDLLADRAAVVHYEKLLSSPENETKKICNEIGVEYFPDMIEYGGHNMPEWRFGDTVEVYNLKRPASEKSDKWMEYTKDPQMWRLMDDYLHDLGPETLNKLGYPYEDLRETLKEHTPPPRRLLSTLSLNKLLKEEQELRNLEFYYEKLLASLQKRGLQATLTEGILRLMSRL